jgi:hypothetical protein
MEFDELQQAAWKDFQQLELFLDRDSPAYMAFEVGYRYGSLYGLRGSISNATEILSIMAKKMAASNSSDLLMQERSAGVLDAVKVLHSAMAGIESQIIIGKAAVMSKDNEKDK